MRVSKGLRQAYELQDIAHEAAVSFANSCREEGANMKVNRQNAAVLASLIRAWDCAQERVRIHRGRPLPGSFRPGGMKQVAAGSSGLVE